MVIKFGLTETCVFCGKPTKDILEAHFWKAIFDFPHPACWCQGGCRVHLTYSSDSFVISIGTQISKTTGLTPKVPLDERIWKIFARGSYTEEQWTTELILEKLNDNNI
jgi:hypothetical protein